MGMKQRANKDKNFNPTTKAVKGREGKKVKLFFKFKEMSLEQASRHVRMMHAIVELKHTFKGPWRRVDRVAAIQAAAASVGGVFQEDDFDHVSVSVRIPIKDDDSHIKAFADALTKQNLAAPYINACIEWRRPHEPTAGEIDAWIKKVKQHGGKVDGDFGGPEWFELYAYWPLLKWREFQPAAAATSCDAARITDDWTLFDKTVF